MKLIGIDNGTSTVCGVLYDTTTGQSKSLSKAHDTWLKTSHLVYLRTINNQH